MNKKNLWIAVLTGAVLTTLVSNIPFISLINCLLCAGFWGGAIFSVWFYRRLSGSVTVRQGVIIGLLTGVCAGVLGFALSFAGLAGAAGFANSYKDLLPADATKDMDLPAWGQIVINLLGVIFNVAFGTLGGWIGGSIFKPRVKPEA